MRTYCLPFLLLTFLFYLPSISFSQVIVNAEIIEDEQSGMVDIHIVGDNFPGIIGFQFGMYWDEEILQLDSITNFGVHEMDRNDFGYIYAEYGHLMVSWTDPAALTQYASSGHLLFTIRLKRIGEGTIELVFGKLGYGGPIEVFNDDLIFEEFTSTQNLIFTDTKPVFGELIMDANKDCLVQDNEDRADLGILKFDGRFNFFGSYRGGDYQGYFRVDLPYGEYEVTYMPYVASIDHSVCIPSRTITISESIDRLDLTYLIQFDSIPIPDSSMADTTQDIESEGDIDENGENENVEGGNSEGSGGPIGCDNCDVSDDPEGFYDSNSKTWLPEGTTWRYSYTVFDGPEGINKYQIVGKEIIQGKECSMLKKSPDPCLGRPELDYIYKEDNRIYYFDFEKEAFQLLYDFSIEVGEVLKVPLWEDLNYREDTLYVRVDSISTFQLDTVSLKHFFVSYGTMQENVIEYYTVSSPFQIIEDIGNLRNFFHLVENGFCDYGHTNPLRCFTHPVYGTLSFTDENCDALVLPTKEILEAEGRIFPNPIADQLFIELPYQGIINWKVFSMKGKLMQEGVQEIQRNTPFSFQVEHLPSSLYYIVIFDEHQQFLKKEKFVKL